MYMFMSHAFAGSFTSSHFLLHVSCIECFFTPSYNPPVVEGPDVQDALTQVTGSRTVPQVFVGGKFVGGCDGTCHPTALMLVSIACCAYQSRMSFPIATAR